MGGVDGFVSVGGVGEYAVFTVEERKGIVETEWKRLEDRFLL